MAWLFLWIFAAGFVNVTRVGENPWQRLGYVIPMMFGFVLIFHNPRWHTFLFEWITNTAILRQAGVAMTGAGLLFSIWARFHLGKFWSAMVVLKEDHRLIRTGPYRFVRHPIYTGFLSAAAGSALAAYTPAAIIGLAMIWISIFFKLKREEALLLGEFGDEYREYQKAAAMLFPPLF